jgi:hypothetical protein
MCLVFIEFSGKSSCDDFLIWEEIDSTLTLIRENLQSTNNKSTKYGSFNKYYDDTYKHVRKETSPSEVFKMPVTYNQEFGFYKFMEKNLNEVRYPKKKCEETKYAESIIMTGKQFMK